MTQINEIFLLIVGLIALALVLALAFMYVADRMQVDDAIRRNFPILGRFRHAFLHLGEFFRAYFFAADREELPFNRAEREWIDAASEKEIGDTVAFGSTRNLGLPGTAIFVNAAFPLLDQDMADTPLKTIGPNCPQPYTPGSCFNISAMSYGSISKPAVRALAKGAARAGVWLNTGEGGLAPAHLEGGGEIVFQIGTAKYGVRQSDGQLDEAKFKAIAGNPQVKMIEIKLSQGAKPGKGGILPAAKVSEEIAEIRGIPVGEDSLSPNRHPDIANASELLDQIERLRRLSGKPVGFKAVFSGTELLDDLCKELGQRGLSAAPDFITVDGGEGGTGASPMPLIDLVGLPLSEALVMVSDQLHAHGLRERIRLIASGKLVTPENVAWALASGADYCVSARGFMFALGCIQALKCDKNSCPTGITTNDPDLQKGLVVTDKAQRVATYVAEMGKQLDMIAHACGVLSPDQLDRQHVRIVQNSRQSTSLAQLSPWPQRDE